MFLKTRKASCGTNTLTRRSLKPQRRLSFGRAYHNTVFAVPRSYPQAGGRAIRPAAGQFRRRSHFAEGGGPAVGTDPRVGRLLARRAASRQGTAPRGRTAAAAGNGHRLWVRGRQ